MVAPYRLGFSDSNLRDLYRTLRPSVSDLEIDRGTQSLGYTQGAPRTTATARDRYLDASELFDLISNRPSLAPAYRNFAGEPLPWLATTGFATQGLLRQFDAMVGRWRRSHREAPAPGPDLLRRIYDWVLAPDGGRMMVDETARELEIEGIAAQRRGDCTEFAKLFLLLLNRVGFSPYPVWVQRDMRGDEVEHIVTGITVGNHTYLLDPVYQRFDAPHQSFARMSLRELLGWHWNNRAQDIEGFRPRRAIELYTRALLVDPQNPHFLTNRGIIRMREGESAQARADFQAALRAVPNFHLALFQLGNLEFDAGRYGPASRLFRRAIRLAPRVSDYRLNLVLSLSRGGDRVQARREFNELLRLDPSQAHVLPQLGS